MFHRPKITEITEGLTPFFVAVVLLTACGPAKEKEPNDSHQQATAMRPGQKATGTIQNGNDHDWYRLEVKEDGVLSARIGGIRDIDFVLSVLDKDRRELKRVDETTVGGDEQALDVGVSPGPYYVLVANKNAEAKNPDQPYELATTLIKGGNREREPNDGALTAQPVEAGGLVRGHYWPTRNLLLDDPEAAEEDWFAVVVDRPGLFLLNADLSETPKVDPILEVDDTNGYKLKELDGGGVGEGESLRSFGVRGPAKYLLRLRAKNKNMGNPDVPYDLMTELLPYQGRNEFEPNDQRADATPLELESIQGLIAPPGDQDWYKLEVSTAAGKQLLRAELSGMPGMDLTLSLRDALGNEIVTVDNMGREQPETLTGYGAAASELYLVVAEKSGRRAEGRQGYTLAKKVIPWQAGLEWEPNDSTATVQSLKIGDSVDGYFAPKGDADWYEFNLYQRGTVELELTGVVNVSATVALFDQEYNQLGASAAPKPGEPVVLKKELDRGTYVVRLKAADALQNNVRDKYSLRVRAQ